MAHVHGHDHGNHGDAKRLIAAFVVIAVFMVVEAIGGILSGSLALLADATHMLTDAFALALAASAHWLSSKPSDERLHFGYRRLQVLAAFVNGVLLSLLLVWILIEAVQRMISPTEVLWPTMLVIAIVGLAANAAAFVILHGADRKNMNINGAMLHVISDMLGSVAAVIAAVVIATTGWMQIDPILSIVVAALIGRSAYRLIRDSGHILLEGAPENIDVESVVEGLRKAAPDISDIHQVRIWQLTPDHPRLTMHVCVREPGQAQNVLATVRTYLASQHGVENATIQVEISNTCPGCFADQGTEVATASASASTSCGHSSIAENSTNLTPAS